MVNPHYIYYGLGIVILLYFGFIMLIGKFAEQQEVKDEIKYRLSVNLPHYVILMLLIYTVTHLF